MKMLKVTTRAFFTLSGSVRDLATNFILYSVLSGIIKKMNEILHKGYATLQILLIYYHNMV